MFHMFYFYLLRKNVIILLLCYTMVNYNAFKIFSKSSLYGINPHSYHIITFLEIYLLIMLLQLSHFPPFTPLHPAHHLPPTLPPYSSCLWVILISSLASTFPILFLTSPCLFSTYHLCYLFSVTFFPSLPLPLPHG